jgi:hypothetical protein
MLRWAAADRCPGSSKRWLAQPNAAEHAAAAAPESPVCIQKHEDAPAWSGPCTGKVWRRCSHIDTPVARTAHHKQDDRFDLLVVTSRGVCGSSPLGRRLGSCALAESWISSLELRFLRQPEKHVIAIKLVPIAGTARGDLVACGQTRSVRRRQTRRRLGDGWHGTART